MSDKNILVYTAGKGGKECEYCGIMSFSHKHIEGDVPKNYIRIPEVNGSNERFEVWDNELHAIMLNSFKCVEHEKEVEHDIKPIRDFIRLLLKKERKRVIEDLEDTFYIKEQTHNGWLMTGLSIRLEDWKAFKLKE